MLSEGWVGENVKYHGGEGVAVVSANCLAMALDLIKCFNSLLTATTPFFLPLRLTRAGMSSGETGGVAGIFLPQPQTAQPLLAEAFVFAFVFVSDGFLESKNCNIFSPLEVENLLLSR